MSSKKHLGSKARRFTRRAAVRLSEFLRGDDEPNSQVQSQGQPNESQITNMSSIGTIPSIGQADGFVTVSPVVSPSTPTDDTEKASPPLPPTQPVNVWKLPPGERSQPDGAFMPDKMEFPDLGKHLKSSKTLPEKATRKDQAVDCWLSSVRSVDDTNQAASSPSKKFTLLKRGSSSSQQQQQDKSQQKVQMQQHISPEKPASSTPGAAPMPVLRPSQQQQQKQQKTPASPSQMSGSRTAQPRGGPYQQQPQEKSPGRPGPLKVQLQQHISPEKPASSTSGAAPMPEHRQTQQKTPASPSQQKIQQQQQMSGSRPSQPRGAPFQQQPQEKNPGFPASHISSKKPTFSTASGAALMMAAPTLFQEDEEQDVGPRSPFSMNNTQRRMAAARKRTSHRHNHNESFWRANNEPSPGKLSAQEQAKEKQAEVLPQPSQNNQSSLHSIWQSPPISTRSMLNVNAQEFRPRTREQYSADWGSTQQALAQQPQPGEEFHRRGARLSKRRRRQRYLRSLKPESLLSIPGSSQVFFQEEESQERGQGQPYEHVQLQGQSQASVQRPTCYYSAPALVPVHTHNQQQRPVLVPVSQLSPAHPVTPAPIYTTPTGQIPIVMQNADASQSVFRLASLPSTGVGTTDNSTCHTDMGTTSLNPLPSSISGPSNLSHTLSSAVGDYHESSINQDLLYSRPLLDMEREDAQGENQDQGQGQGCGWQLEPNFESQIELQPLSGSGSDHQPIEVDAEPRTKIRNKVFRAPSDVTDYPKPDFNCVPSSIKKLHRLITLQNSDYSFLYALSAQLGQECVPMDCYVYLKMVLLASIVSIEPDELRPPISLCVIATDSLLAHRLMNSVGQLAPRFVGPHEYGLQPTIVGGALSLRYNWVVASPLLLAQQGVYYAGDWTRLSKEHCEQIEKCVENGAVPVPQLQSDQALEAAIWTHWQPENSSNQTLAFAKLCPIFGLPIYMGDAQVSDSLWNFLLRQHTKEGQLDDQNDGLNIPEEDLRMLLHLLHQRKVTFDDQAQHMLQKYYVISRKERPTVFTSKTYIVLKQFAESFAKLALRLEVLESDVCVAIFHCEHFVQQIFGTKDMSSPPPVVNSFRVISHIDPYMNEFARWLLQYLDRYDDNELGMHKAKRRRTDSWGLL